MGTRIVRSSTSVNEAAQTFGMRLGDLPDLLRSLPRLDSEDAHAFGAELAAAREQIGNSERNAGMPEGRPVFPD